MRKRTLALVAFSSLLLGGCTTRLRLVNPDAIPSIDPLPVQLGPQLCGLEDRVTNGHMTVLVPTGELLAYYFPGAAAGGAPRATLQLVDSHLDLDASEARGAGALGLLDTPMHLSMVGGYTCQYTLVVEAVTADGARHRLTGRGEARAPNDGQAALRSAVIQAATALHQQVGALIAEPAPAVAQQ